MRRVYIAIAITQTWMPISAIPVSYRNRAAIPARTPAANMRRVEMVRVKTGIIKVVLIRLNKDTGITALLALAEYRPKSQARVTRDVQAATDLRKYDEATV